MPICTIGYGASGMCAGQEGWQGGPGMRTEYTNGGWREMGVVGCGQGLLCSICFD